MHHYTWFFCWDIKALRFHSTRSLFEARQQLIYSYMTSRDDVDEIDLRTLSGELPPVSSEAFAGDLHGQSSTSFETKEAASHDPLTPWM